MYNVAMNSTQTQACSTAQTVIREGTFAHRALQVIRTQPGINFTALHEILRPTQRTYQGTSRDRDKLVRADLIRTERDGRSVRHYVIEDEPFGPATGE